MLKQTGLEMKKINFLNFSAKYFRCAWQLTKCYAIVWISETAETLVIKQFYPKEGGLRRGWEGAEQLLNWLVAFFCYKHFHPIPCFVLRVHTKPLYFERGVWFSLFCTQQYRSKESLLYRAAAQTPLQKLADAAPWYSTYGHRRANSSNKDQQQQDSATASEPPTDQYGKMSWVHNNKCFLL